MSIDHHAFLWVSRLSPSLVLEENSRRWAAFHSPLSKSPPHTPHLYSLSPLHGINSHTLSTPQKSLFPKINEAAKQLFADVENYNDPVTFLGSGQLLERSLVTTTSISFHFSLFFPHSEFSIPSPHSLPPSFLMCKGGWRTPRGTQLPCPQAQLRKYFASKGVSHVSVCASCESVCSFSLSSLSKN